MSNWLASEDFKSVVKHTILVSIDLIIENSKGEVLLGVRNNAPAKNFWFVPGGRIRKGEILEKAFQRISVDETGINISFNEAFFIGIYDHLYAANVFNDQSFGTQYIVLAYKVILDINIDFLPKIQHRKYNWFTKYDLLTNKDVHPNIKNYFIKGGS